MRRSQRSQKRATRSKAGKKEEAVGPKVPASTPGPSKRRMLKGAQAKTGNKQTRVRVWWPPTDDSKKTGYSGMYWPANLLSEDEDLVRVQYDNGDKETVNAENLQPGTPPLDFGKETKPLQVGEFVEVSNDSDTDPAEWVGVVKKENKKKYTISYPFHDSADEDIKEELLRRARVWDTHLGKWLFVQPFQEWEDGDVTSPVELFLCTERELFAFLAGDRKKVRVGRKERSSSKGARTPGRSSGEGGDTVARPQDAENKKTPEEERPSQDNLPEESRASQEEAMTMQGVAGASTSGTRYQRFTTPAAMAAPSEAATRDLPVQQATVGGGRIPRDWMPAPNLGPGSYIVPSQNPNEEPYVVHVSPAGPQETEPPTPANNQETAGSGPKKKRKKDPNAPRKPATAYILFTTAHRDRVKEEMGPDATAQDITKKLAEMWTQVSAEEKRVLQEQVDIERMRYEEALRNYVPPSDLEDLEDEDAPRKRAKKDADAPKRPRTAYILFSIDYRREADRGIDFKTATNMAADAWKNAEPSVRAKYDALAANEKDAYEAALKVYQQYKEARLAREREEARRATQQHFQIPGIPVAAQSTAHQQQSSAPPRQGSGPPATGNAAFQPGVVAGYPTDTLERLNLETAKQALKREKLHPDAYYMLVDAWRHDSPRLEAALRAYRLHIEGQKKPDYKGFLVGIFGLEAMRPLMTNSNPPPAAERQAG